MATLVDLTTRFGKVQLTGDALYDSDGDQLIGNQGAAVAAVAGTVAAGSTGTFGFKTATDRNAAVATVIELKTSLNLVITRLRAHGLIDT